MKKSYLKYLALITLIFMSSIFTFPIFVSAVDTQDSFSMVSLYGKNSLQKNVSGKIYAVFQNMTAEDLSGLVDIAYVKNGNKIPLAHNRPFSVGEREKAKVFFTGEIPICGEVLFEFSFSFDDGRKKVDLAQGMATVSCASSAAHASFENTIANLPLPNSVKNSVLDTAESITQMVPQAPSLESLKNTISLPAQFFGLDSIPLEEKVVEISEKSSEKEKDLFGRESVNKEKTGVLADKNVGAIFEVSPEKSMYTKVADILSRVNKHSLLAQAGARDTSSVSNKNIFSDFVLLISFLCIFGFLIFLLRGWNGVEERNEKDFQ